VSHPALDLAPAKRGRPEEGAGEGVIADIRRCFAEGEPSAKTYGAEQIRDLLYEDSEAARDVFGVDSANAWDVFGVDSANAWAQGYRFLEEYVTSILPLKMAQQYVPESHLCEAHWCTKKGNSSGQPMGDLSYVDGTPLYTDETGDVATRPYGKIIHPMIDDIANMINDKEKDPSLLWTDLRFMETDIIDRKVVDSIFQEKVRRMAAVNALAAFPLFPL
jgi:hypothetical protein